MYAVVLVLSSAGLHVPVIPFKDVVGKGANESPAQIGSIRAKFGVTIGFTTIVSVWGWMSMDFHGSNQDTIMFGSFVITAGRCDGLNLNSQDILGCPGYARISRITVSL